MIMAFSVNCGRHFDSRAAGEKKECDEKKMTIPFCSGARRKSHL
jgi:hypothetical protein